MIFKVISLVETLLKVKTLLLSPVTSVFFNEQVCVGINHQFTCTIPISVASVLFNSTVSNDK